ncbi:MAG: UDP-N-acetylmuramoyl-L-alanyl-D-glutamate--2,6-diaminopimelate ligase [Clostridia bacterium]|nr:UDP-N-acetylmuramoyl-L-alanyl-D-glutamate--2,6-diaminopimelate ligase [Clostridia bacterium]
MKLKKILEELNYSSFTGDMSVNITGIACDSRKVQEGYLFVCIDGIDEDGHAYIEKAKENGAICVVVSKEVINPFDNVIMVEDGRLALSSIASIFYDHPSKKLKLVGVTGTKGKTTIAMMIKTMLDCDHKEASLSGTLGMFIGDEHIPTKNTTPNALDLQTFFYNSLKKGIHYSVMEVASIALKQKRVENMDFDIGIYTNLAKTHIGKREHEDFNDYLVSKAQLFTKCKTGIFNMDDLYYLEMIKNSTCELITYSYRNTNAGVYARNVVKDGVYTHFTYIGLGREINVTSSLPGSFNVLNALAAITACVLLDVSNEAIIEGLLLTRVKGRCEVLETETPYKVMIDYAHNQSSLLKLLSEIKEGVKGKVITVFGCGGDRDNDMRYEMGEIAGNLSDFTVITSDNPRTEQPESIIAMIEEGMRRTEGNYICITDRTEAIRYAMENAEADDLVILAGKGHEIYIEKNNIRTHYDEREIVAEILEEQKK